MDLLSKHENFESEGTITIFILETFKESIASQTFQPSPIYRLQVCCAHVMSYAYVHTAKCHKHVKWEKNV